MKCFLINLDRSKDRLEFMSDQLSGIGLLIERISAVEGREIPRKDLAALIPSKREWTSEITPAEVGCFLSHKKCLEAIAAGQDNYSIVLEDDVLLSKRASALLLRTDWIPADADIIKIETQGKKVLIGELFSCEGTPYSIGRLKSTHILSAGYIVSRGGAKRILADMNEVIAPIDHFLFNERYGIFSSLSVYQCTPAICKQAGLDSTLQGHRKQVNQRPHFWPRLLREARRIVLRSIIGTRGIWINQMTKETWGRVKYDEMLSD